jgi:hypothetical protein
MFCNGCEVTAARMDRSPGLTYTQTRVRNGLTYRFLNFMRLQPRWSTDPHISGGGLEMGHKPNPFLSKVEMRHKQAHKKASLKEQVYLTGNDGQAGKKNKSTSAHPNSSILSACIKPTQRFASRPRWKMGSTWLRQQPCGRAVQ